MKFIPNGTGKFRFWCQKVLPLVYDDSLSYYEVLCKLTNFVNELAERIANAFDEINTNVKEYVDEWLDSHPEATTTVQDGSITSAKLNSEINLTDEDIYNIKYGGNYSSNKILNGDGLDYYNQLSNYEWDFVKSEATCNVIGELPRNVQGGCWIDDDNYVFAVPDGATTCNVYKWNAKTHVISEPVNLQVYHANSIAYNPTNGYLYFADALTNEANSQLLNTITVVRYSDLSFVKRITSPAEGGIYSIAYDRDNDRFYSTNYRGSTEGQANALYEWNGEFESVNRKIILDDITVRGDKVHSSQGVQLVRDGVAYIPYYDPSRIIIGYNIETGKKVIVANIPVVLNGYRHSRELEAFTYNEDNDQYICFNTNTAFEVGITKSIPEIRINIPPYDLSSLQTTLLVNYDLSMYDSTPTTIRGNFRSFTDARFFAKYNHLSPVFSLFHVNNGTVLDVDENILIENMSCELRCTNSQNIRLNGYVRVYNSQVHSYFLRLNGTDSSTGINTSMLANNSTVSIRSCTFENASNNCDALAFSGSILTIGDVTLSRGVQARIWSTLFNWLGTSVYYTDSTSKVFRSGN